MRRPIWQASGVLHLGAILLAAFGLRAWRLDRLELWFDETASYFVASKPPLEIITYSARAIQEHPPGYYLVLHGWMSLAGDSEFALRYLSLFAGVLFIPALYRVSRHWAGESVALLVAVLATASPFAVAYAQEARMYTWLALLGLLLVISVRRALVAGGAWWLLAGTLIVVGIAFHYLFVLMVGAIDLYVLWRWGRSRQWRPLLLWLSVQAVGVVLLVLWLLNAPGPADTLLDAIRPEWTNQPTVWVKVDRIATDWTVGAIRDDIAYHRALPMAVGLWLLAALGLLATRRTSTNPGRSTFGSDLRALLIITLGVPIAAGVAVVPIVVGRYFIGSLFAFLLAVALGMQALWCWHRSAGTLAGVIVLGIFAYGLSSQYTLDRDNSFGRILRATEAAAAPSDAIVLTHPHLWPQVSYYGSRPLMSYFYVPDVPYPLEPAEIKARLEPIVQSYNRIVLGPVAPAHTDPAAVERTLNKVAFPAEKRWYPDSVFVGTYLSPRPLSSESSSWVWVEALALRRWEHSEPVVMAGDGLRLQLHWEVLKPVAKRFRLSIQLVDAAGQVWAERLSEPCNAWCHTDEWERGDTPDENHALLVPADTPPGRYTVQLSWLDAETGTPVPLTGGGSGVVVTLMDLTVTEALVDVPPPPPAFPLAIRFADTLELLGSDGPTGPVRAGDLLPLALLWRAPTMGSPSTAAHVEVELWPQEGIGPAARWELRLATEAYPPARWQPGRHVRGRHQLAIPPTLAPGRYKLLLQVHDARGSRLPVALGENSQSAQTLIEMLTPTKVPDDIVLQTITVEDRPRSFSLPPIASPLDVRWAQGVALKGAEWAASAAPRDTVPVKLVWQAGGPTDRPYKVFVHLRDQANQVVAQRDDLPAAGAAPSISWARGEVVIDEHPLLLPPDLPPARYALVVGLYYEPTGERLLRERSESDEYVLGTLEVLNR